MQINWFTVIAQIVNFLVLILLLKKFLYKPILDAMDERQRMIAAKEEDAAEKIKNAEAEAEDYGAKKNELEREKERILFEARENAEREKNEYLEKARQKIDQTQKKWEESFAREKDLFFRELRQLAGEQACNVARQTLNDLAGSDLEKMIIKVFIDKLQKMDQEQTAVLLEKIERTNKELKILSAFSIPKEDLKRLSEVIEDKLKGSFDIQHVLSPDLLCGIELEIEGYQISWNMDAYLHEFQEKLIQALGQTET